MLWLRGNFFSFFPWKILTSVPCGAIIMRSKKYRYGLVAQLGAHHIRIVGVVGSNPIRSTEKTPFPLRDGVFYMERVPPVVFNILAFTCVNLHLRANAHLRHVIFFDYQEVPVQPPINSKNRRQVFSPAAAFHSFCLELTSPDHCPK